MPTTPKTFYHVTRAKNISHIQKDGLIPQIGTLGKILGEEIPQIYLFDSLESVDDAIGSWLGAELDNLYGEDEPLLLLRIPKEYVTNPAPTFEDEETSFEWSTQHPIKPEHIIVDDHEL